MQMSFPPTFKGDIIIPSDADYDKAIEELSANHERNVQDMMRKHAAQIAEVEEQAARGSEALLDMYHQDESSAEEVALRFVSHDAISQKNKLLLAILAQPILASRNGMEVDVESNSASTVGGSKPRKQPQEDRLLLQAAERQ